MAKSSKVPAPKADATTDEVKAFVHPFILEHRVGTTERITAMDPMSEDFIRSLRIPYRGKYISRAAPQSESVPSGVMISLLTNRPSQLLEDLVPDHSQRGQIHMGDLGRPWKEEGWIDPSFIVGTACVIQKASSAFRFDTAKVIMDSWVYRKPDTECSSPYDAAPVRATLVNKFEAVKDKLLCYSFIMKYQCGGKGDLRPGNQALVHVWVNRPYLENRGRVLPMYFENAGSFAFILNAVTACMGLEITPAGEVTLTVETKTGPRTTPLPAHQVNELRSLGVLADFSKALASTGGPWSQLMNADWHGVGYDLQPGGAVFNISSQTVHLPWQVQAQRAQVMVHYPTIKRSLGTIGGSSSGARALFELAPSLRKAAISASVAKLLWDKLKSDDTISFDNLIFDLRTDFITGELIDETRRLDETVSGKQLFDATWNSSDKLGRFVFERSLPGYVRPEAVEAQGTD